MSSDTQVSTGDLYTYNIVKIKNIHGYLVGCCGDLDMLHWFHTNFVPDVVDKHITFKLQAPQSSNQLSFEGLIVSPNGKVFLVSDIFMITPISTFGYAAIGSGAAVALGALFSGADSKTAIKAAIRHSGGSGGRITSISLNHKGKRK